MTTELIPVTEGVIEPERISPEGLEVASCYLRTNDLTLTARELDLPKDIVAAQLNNPLVKRYLDAIYMDSGYRNRNKLAEALDGIIDKKFEEMDEAEISSSKDITELLTLAHKLRQDEMKMQMEFLKLQATLKKAETPTNTGTTVNIMDNSTNGSNYGQLMAQLLGLDKNVANKEKP